MAAELGEKRCRVVGIDTKVRNFQLAIYAAFISVLQCRVPIQQGLQLLGGIVPPFPLIASTKNHECA